MTIVLRSWKSNLVFKHSELVVGFYQFLCQRREIKKQSPLFSEVHLHSRGGTSNSRINTTRLLHVLQSTVKYEFCDTYVSCGGYADCEEISHQVIICCFPAPLGGRWARPAEREKEWRGGVREGERGFPSTLLIWGWKLHSLLSGLGKPQDLIKQQVSSTSFLHLSPSVSSCTT